MFNQLVAQVADAIDTPARVIAPRANVPNASSREDLERDPFKSRPKVALSPPLSAQASSHNPFLLTRTDYHSSGLLSSPDHEMDDDYLVEDYDSSPLKGKGQRKREQI